MRVILDGPDGGGKSTTAEGLRSIFQIPVIKYTVPESDEELRDRIERTLLFGMSAPIILDRWHYPADMIYCDIVEQRQSSILEYGPRLMEWLLKNDVLYVYLTARPDVLVQRHTGAPNDYVQPEQLEAIAQQYEDWMQLLLDQGVGVARIDTTAISRSAALCAAGRAIVDYYAARYYNVVRLND